jgi:molybdopterin/thiamine biosynthesis adenylyltransferase/rhodanese-related sulfurtransferase
MNRYARQMQLPEVSQAGQAKLSKARVVVVGAGGLGSPVLQYLAGAGGGQILIVDPDHVEETNLHRQPVYQMSDLGRPKADAARAALHRLNPAVEVEARVEPLGPGTAPDIVAGADIVIDAADSFAVSYILSDACSAAGRPLVSASVLGQTGYVGGFCGGTPSLRAVFPELPASGATCATAGVLGPVVGVIGALQAQMALRVLLEVSPSPLGQMTTADLAGLSFGGFSFLGSPEPEQAFPFVATHMIAAKDLVIDLRNRQESPDDIVPHAVRVSETEMRGVGPTPGQRIVLCCQTGLRAWRAATALREDGAGNIALLAAKACT